VFGEVQFDTYPSPPTSRTNTTLIGSIQDRNALSLSNVTASISIMKEGKQIYSFPKEIYRFGDFTVPYVFEDDGFHEVVLAISQGGRDIEVGFRFAVWSEQVAFLLSYGTILAIVIPLAIIGILFWRSWHYDSGEAVKADGEAERLDTTSAPNLPSPPSGEPSRGWLRPSRGDRRRRDLHPPPLSDI